ncbi:hypothetical protein [Microbacterium arborescens]
MSLRLVSHPLPVAWDGREVRWGRWGATDHIRICPPRASRCDSCGSARSPFLAVGLRAADAGPGRFTRRHALRDLHAFRCPDCGEVVVWDMDSDEWWTLDESDYGPEGSRPPAEWTGGLFDLLDTPE